MFLIDFNSVLMGFKITCSVFRAGGCGQIRLRQKVDLLPTHVASLWLGISNFSKGLEIGHFGGLGGPGGHGDPSERSGDSRLTFLKAFPGSRGRPDFKNAT